MSVQGHRVGQGKPLVEGVNSYLLCGVSNADNSGYDNIVFDSGGGTTIDITSLISNGRLKGLIDLRDAVLPNTIDQLDRLAAAIVNEVNQQHRLGFALDDTTANDFFGPLSPQVSALSANTGSANVTAAVTGPATLTPDPYELSFAGGNYTLRNLTTGASTTAAYVDPTTFTFEGIQVTISGAAANGDVYRLSAHAGTAGSSSVAITDTDKIAAAAALPGDNRNALLLAQLQDRSVSALGSVDFQSYYSGFVGGIGAQSQTATRNLAAQELVINQLNYRREAVSGISLDEELANLIKFQKAYEASARFMVIVDELLQTLMELKR